MSTEPRCGTPRRTAATAVVLLVVLLVPALAPTGAAGYRSIQTQTEEVTGRSVLMVAPAVAELPDGTLEGVAMEMQATIRDGSGGVYVDTRPLTQVDMQGSARLAATMAAALSGEDLADHDFFVTMRSPSPAVGGPSAGAAMAVAFTALLLGLPVRDDVVMTGMINPDGSIGPIGGVLEKAEAAHEAGATLFLIPEGQSIVRRTVREVQEGEGWFPTVVTREEQVDVVAYAEERWGLEVREMRDVYEAVEFTTDHRIARPAVPDEMREPLFAGVMREASRAQVDEMHERRVDLRGRLDSGDPAMGGETRTQLVGVLDRAAAKLALADGAFGNASYYTASSRAFQASIDLRLVALTLGAVAAPDDAAYLQTQGRAAADRLEAARDNASAVAPATVSAMEAVGAAQVRVLEAQQLLDQAEALLSDARLAEALQALAFGIERTRSVDWWTDIAARLVREDRGARLEAAPEDLSRDYFSIAQQAVVYAQVLLSQTGTDQVTGRLLTEGATSLEQAQEAARAGLHVGALYLAMEAQVAGHAALSLVGTTDAFDDRIMRQRDRALIQIAQTREVGAEPFLAVSYLEFAGSLAADQPVDALLMYGNAATIAATSAILATGDVCGFGGLSCAAERPAITRVNVPGADPWTAYLALATVVLGFMAGVLVTLVVLQNRDRRHPVAVPGPSRPGAPGPVPRGGFVHARRRMRPVRARPAVPPSARAVTPVGARAAAGDVRLHYAPRGRPGRARAPAIQK